MREWKYYRFRKLLDLIMCFIKILIILISPKELQSNQVVTFKDLLYTIMDIQYQIILVKYMQVY